jgi:hypothetical protein
MSTKIKENCVPPFIIRNQDELYLLWRMHRLAKVTCCVNISKKTIEMKMLFSPPFEKEVEKMPIDISIIRSAYLNELVYLMEILLPSHADLTHQDRLHKYADESFQGLVIPLNSKKEEKFTIQ